ncbi:MAG TPA: adenosylmethionine decarboxylase [Oculatellaceae cyanobacterium]
MDDSTATILDEVSIEHDTGSEYRPSEVSYEATGTHLLLTLADCRADLINDADGLKAMVRRAAEATGATVLQIVAHRFQPQGTTVVAVLAESHASLHTYPESKTVFWDCFTCGTTCRPELSETVLAAALLPERVNKKVVLRGDD